MCDDTFYLFEYKLNRAVESFNWFLNTHHSCIHWRCSLIISNFYLLKAFGFSFDALRRRKNIKMNVWWFLSALLFWIVICNADPANNIQIGFNCIGITTATRIFETVEVIKAIDDNAADKPWYTRMFNSAPKTILTVVKTYPPVNDSYFVQVASLSN